MYGIVSALLAASSWTYACYLWRKQTKYFSASNINIIKNIIAFIIFSPVIITFDVESSFIPIIILFISGIIGISLGDTFYIISLEKLGTRLTLSIEAISPIIATILGSIFLNEALSLKSWLGILIVSISLLGVAFQKTINHQQDISQIERRKGLLFAILSVFCAVIAASLSRFVLKNYDLNPFQTTEIRLLGSILALLPTVRNNLVKSIKKIPLNQKYRLLTATLLGTNIGILLQQNVFKLLPIGLGWTLLSTSPLFAFICARSEGEEFNSRTLALTILAVLGLAIAFI